MDVLGPEKSVYMQTEARLSEQATSLSNPKMSSKELDHLVIRQLQLRNTTAISYRNVPHAITDEQRDINSTL